MSKELGPLHSSGGGHNVAVCPPIYLYLPALQREVVQVHVVFRVDHVSDVSGQFPEEQGLYDIVQ
jgi:hypothetical protein